LKKFLGTHLLKVVLKRELFKQKTSSLKEIIENAYMSIKLFIDYR